MDNSLLKKTLSMWEVLRQDFAPVMADSLAALMEDMTSRMQAGEPRATFTTENVSVVTYAFSLIYDGSTRATYKLMNAEFKDAFSSGEEKVDQEQEIRIILQRYFDTYGNMQATQVLQTTRNQVEAMVAGGVARGEAETAVFSRIINKIPEIALNRAEIITMTEIHSSSQFASQALAERSRIGLKKKWNSVNDERTRDFLGRMDEFNHRVMDGTEVGLDQSFSVPNKYGGFEQLKFPGDPAGSAGNIINCRCVQTYERVG